MPTAEVTVTWAEGPDRRRNSGEAPISSSFGF